eukprot:4083729-Alexandrium_andersonii.AAC.1
MVPTLNGKFADDRLNLFRMWLENGEGHRQGRAPARCARKMLRTYRPSPMLLEAAGSCQKLLGAARSCQLPK